MDPYYDDGQVVIYNADCADVLPTVNPSDVALVLTDPPYGISVRTDQSRLSHPGHTGHTVYPPVEGDDEPFDPAHLLRFSRVVLWGANHYAPLLPPGGRWLIWRKRDASPLLAAAEMAWHTAGGRSVDVYESTIKGMKVREGAVHPTQKPVDLMRWVVEKFTHPGDLVLDPYMGSGPVARACSDTGRCYLGVELVEDYCKVAVGRLAQQALDMSDTA